MHPGTAALDRGLHILQVLGKPEAAGRGLTVNELADTLATDKSQISRTLATLASRGFLDRDERTRAYRIGPQIHLLAARTAEARLLHVAPPILHGLVVDLGESAHLSVRQDDSVLTLLSEVPTHTALVAPARVGGLTPLATTSAGRILALALPSESLTLHGFDAAAIAAVEQARSDGYAIVREEFEAGLVAAAAPVLAPDGHVIAAINVSAPAFRFSDRLDEAATHVQIAARLVANRLADPAAGTRRTTR